MKDGNEIEGAAIYDSSAPGPHPIMMLHSNGEEINWSEIPETWQIDNMMEKWNSRFDESWKAKSISEVQLVGFIDIDYAVRSIIPYDDGYELHRITYFIDISLYEALTANLVDEISFLGTDPPRKIDQFIMFTSKIKYEGGSIPMDEALNWLERILYPKKYINSI